MPNLGLYFFNNESKKEELIHLFLVTDFTCHLKVWLLGIGYIITFGGIFLSLSFFFFPIHSILIFYFEALFVKSWRICRLYYNKTVEIIRISDRKVWALIGFLLLIEIIPLIIFSAASGMEAEVKQPDIYRPSYNFTGN